MSVIINMHKNSSNDKHLLDCIKISITPGECLFYYTHCCSSNMAVSHGHLALLTVEEAGRCCFFQPMKTFVSLICCRPSSRSYYCEQECWHVCKLLLMRVWFTFTHEVGPWGAEDNRKICHLVSSPDRSLTKLLPGPPASVSHPHLTYFPRFLGRRQSPPCTFCLLQCLSRARCSRGPLLVVAWDSPPCLASCYHAEWAVCMYWPYDFGFG